MSRPGCGKGYREVFKVSASPVLQIPLPADTSPSSQGAFIAWLLVLLCFLSTERQKKAAKLHKNQQEKRGQVPSGSWAEILPRFQLRNGEFSSFLNTPCPVSFSAREENPDIHLIRGNQNTHPDFPTEGERLTQTGASERAALLTAGEEASEGKLPFPGVCAARQQQKGFLFFLVMKSFTGSRKAGKLNNAVVRVLRPRQHR